MRSYTIATMGKKPQPALIRIAHWVNVPTLIIMMMSGLQILRAYPYFGPQGAQWEWLPFQGSCEDGDGFFSRVLSRCSPGDWSEWMRGGFDGEGSGGDFLGHLAGARHLHFMFAWVLVINGLIYLAYQIKTKEYRRRFFWPPRDAKPALHQALYYLRIRKTPPKTDLYNGLQRQAYTMAIALGILEVLSGFVIYKPTQLQWLGYLMGGYDGARVIHLFALLGLMGFIVGHLIMVIAHWRQFPEMVHGGHAQTGDADPSAKENKS